MKRHAENDLVDFLLSRDESVHDPIGLESTDNTHDPLQYLSFKWSRLDEGVRCVLQRGIRVCAHQIYTVLIFSSVSQGRWE